MRLLILLLVIMIGNARARECYYDTPTDYSINNNVLTFNSECTSIGFTDLDCYWFPDGVRSVVLQQGVTEVRDYAFYRCSSLTSVTFPNSLRSVGLEAFLGCESLTSVTFPRGLEQVGADAFRYTWTSTLTCTPSSNPCYDGNYHSDACKNKITTEYNKAQFIDLYTYGNYETCN